MHLFFYFCFFFFNLFSFFDFIRSTSKQTPGITSRERFRRLVFFFLSLPEMLKFSEFDGENFHSWLRVSTCNTQLKNKKKIFISRRNKKYQAFTSVSNFKYQAQFLFRIFFLSRKKGRIVNRHVVVTWPKWLVAKFTKM